MSPSRSIARHRSPALLAGAAVMALIAVAAPATGQPAAGPSPLDYGFQGEGEARVHDVDRRTGVVAPSQAALDLAADLGATAPRWNEFGTPHVLFNQLGALTGPRGGAAADVARAFLRENAALFRLDAASVDALTLLNDAALYDSPDLTRVRDGLPPGNADVAHAVLFRQDFGDLPSALDGLVTVGVQADGSVVWLSSSITGDRTVSGDLALSPAAAIAAAAQDVDLDLGSLRQLGTTGRDATFASDVVSDVQRARLVALPTPQDGVRRAYEVTLLDTALDEHGNPRSFISFVDAESGRVWQRTNKVEHLAQGFGALNSVTMAAPVGTQAAPSAGAYSVSTDTNGCGAPHAIEVPAGTAQITATAQSTDNPNTDGGLADLVVNILRKGAVVASGDTAGNPEAVTYAPPANTLPGTYAAQVCNVTATDPAFDYTGNFVLSPVGVAGGDDGSGNGLVQLPTYKVFPANPAFVAGRQPSEVDSTVDERVLWCWDSRRDPAACAEQLRNDASRLPWDVNSPSLPSFTTDGNNASTAISQVSFLTPDTLVNRPVSPTREYDFAFKNAWFESSCNPTNFGTVADDRNDEAASTTNLFAQHNRMHDWSYYLGFTETNYNLQKDNFGNTGPERANDPELGSSQAGRTTFNGRDNANQITLQDGTPGITNQYLWQPLAGAFYAPCVDGAYDQAVVAHEYGHAITNRMIGGPDGGTGPTQGQTESWSDLQFAAYFTEFAISAGEGVNPYVLGPYVTGSPESGIRNYAMNDSPLNYSDLDYDGNGLGSPHANGEIWSATNFDLLSRLNAKYDAAFPSTDSALQNRCARGQLPADECPGNRRWNQMQYDSFLLQPTGVSMVDTRDAMLAADMMRFGGANQAELWDVFAARGLGKSASTTGPSDVQAVPGWDSPLRTDEADITFAAPAGAADVQLYVGDFEARATPVADTDADTKTSDRVQFLPGTYEFIARADGFGAQRFTETFTAGQTRTVSVPLRRNLASVHNGATAAGDGVNLKALIDDTELTNWASLVSADTASEGKGEGAQVEGRQVTVDLAGDAPVQVSEVQVSAALRGPMLDADGEPAPGEPDAGAQNRFSALRSFDVLTCNAASGADCTASASFTKVFASTDDAFPGERPRPTVPDLIVRPFDVTDTLATHLRLVVRDNQCTGGPDYQGQSNPEADPLFNPDCDTQEASPDREVLNPPTEIVRAAELQVFSAPVPAPAPAEPTKPGKGKSKGAAATMVAGGSAGSGAGSGSGSGDATVGATAAQTQELGAVVQSSATRDLVLPRTGAAGWAAALALGLLLLAFGTLRLVQRPV